jgi:hypothetical protein
MYSYEDRIRAVELYIKLGKRVRPTCLRTCCPRQCGLCLLRHSRTPGLLLRHLFGEARRSPIKSASDSSSSVSGRCRPEAFRRFTTLLFDLLSSVRIYCCMYDSLSPNNMMTTEHLPTGSP